LFCKLLELGGASPRKDVLPQIGTTSPARLGDLGENNDWEPCLLESFGLSVGISSEDCVFNLIRLGASN